MLKKEKVEKSIVVTFRLLLVFIFILFLNGCSSKSTEPDVWEFKLLSANIDTRNVTNQFGGITGTEKYFQYSYADYKGKVMFDEHKMYDTYYVNYSLEFQIGEENKVVQYNYPSNTLWIFVMTPEMHSQVFQTK